MSNITYENVVKYVENDLLNDLLPSCVSEDLTIDEMVDAKDGIKMQLREEIEIPSVDTPVCYRIVDGKKKIYATLEDNDVVVKDHDELKSVIKSLSGHYEEFNRSVQKIKTFNKTSNS